MTGGTENVTRKLTMCKLKCMHFLNCHMRICSVEVGSLYCGLTMG